MLRSYYLLQTIHAYTNISIAYEGLLRLQTRQLYISLSNPQDKTRSNISMLRRPARMLARANYKTPGYRSPSLGMYKHKHHQYVTHHTLSPLHAHRKTPKTPATTTKLSPLTRMMSAPLVPNAVDPTIGFVVVAAWLLVTTAALDTNVALI